MMLYPKYKASPAFTKSSGEPPNSGGACSGGEFHAFDGFQPSNAGLDVCYLFNADINGPDLRLCCLLIPPVNPSHAVC